MSTHRPKISIITPSLNQGDYIEQAITSVLEQQYDNFEHIIMDGGSTDQTYSVVQRYPHLLWVAQPQLGLMERLNEGVRIASGDIVGYLSTDDLYLPNCFHTVKDYMSNCTAVDIVYGDFQWIGQTGTILQYRRELDFDLFMLKYLHFLYISVVASFFRRKVFDDGNFLDARYAYSGDYEFLLRLALKGYRFAHVRSFLTNFRWHTASLSMTVGPEQREEHRQALLLNDPFLLALPAAVRGSVERLLTGSARTKRIILKATKGYYFHQWPKPRLLQALGLRLSPQPPASEKTPAVQTPSWD